MMKKNREMPKTVVQRFEPNEYVAACYSVVCNVNDANNVERDWRILWNGRWTNNYAAGQTHSSSACGALGNYYAFDNNNDGRIDGLTEYSADQGPLACTLYTDVSYKTQAQWNTIDVNSGIIYWVTKSADGNRAWHHQGMVQAADASHPNRS